MPEYAGTAGKFAAFLNHVDGKQPGDPERAAELIVQMFHDQLAPQRLPLGKYAVKKIRDTANQRLREVDEWADRASNTDLSVA
jgi:DNA-binding transcriptional regulator YbjK